MEDKEGPLRKRKPVELDPSQPSIKIFRGKSKSSQQYSTDSDDVLQSLLSSIKQAPRPPVYKSQTPDKSLKLSKSNPGDVKYNEYKSNVKYNNPRLEESKKTYGSSPSDSHKLSRASADFDALCASPNKRQRLSSPDPYLDAMDDSLDGLLSTKACDLSLTGMHRQLDPTHELTAIDDANDNIVTAPLSEDIKKDLEFVTDPITGKQHINFYWYDCAEDSYRNPGVVYLFGKVYAASIKQFVSCCVIVRNLKRTCYLLRRKTLDDEGSVEVTHDDVVDEFKSLYAKKLKISDFTCKEVQKLYAFDKEGVPTTGDYVELTYSCRQPTIPPETKGRTFSHVLNLQQSCVEKLILDLNLRGPCWLRIEEPVSSTPPMTWARIEIILNNPEFLTVHEDNINLKKPYLSLLSICMRTYSNPVTKQNEIIAISGIFNKGFYLDKCLSQKDKISGHFCVLAKPPANRELKIPYDFPMALKRYNKTRLEYVDSERDLISKFLDNFMQIDPDLVVGHDILSFDYETLIFRMKSLKIGTWHKLGRVRRSELPTSKTALKSMFSGRLICDVRTSTMELIKARSYDLTELTSHVLKKTRTEYSQADLVESFKSSEGLIRLINATMQDNDYIFSIMVELNVIPLALKITAVTGHIMSRTLLGGRSERNEYLLLHAFHEKGYICPEKFWASNSKNIQKSNKEEKSDEAEADDEKQAATGPIRKKAAYAGGLVLEPKVGYYNNFILLMDFNSLYPSIIQEYNICFSTIKPVIQDGENSEHIADLPNDLDLGAEGILPSELKKLVDRRKQVKELMKSAKNPDQVLMLDIEQKAIKLTANSMYGCLGFEHSRFYAKHLASLVTFKGREILMSTKALVEKLGHEVIYGDTDSLMINTNLSIYDEVISKGIAIKMEINKTFRLLEIDIDGVYRPLLLLKKKNYAGLTVKKLDNGEFVTTQETKGLDTVRRDRAVIAKEAGEHVLSEILSTDKESDTIMDNIHNYLKDLGEKIRENKLPVESYMISKQLNRNPEEYKDTKGLGHVMVAVRHNQDVRKAKKMKSGDTVQYIICDDGTQRPANQRAYQRDEMDENPLLKIDIDYYLCLQIHPVITRFCEPFSSTNAYILAEMLGVEKSTSLHLPRIESKVVQQEAVTSKGDLRYISCKPLSIQCPRCSQLVIIHNKLKNLTNEEISARAMELGVKEIDVRKFKYPLQSCEHCLYKFTLDRNNILKQLLLILRDLTNEFYNSWYVCEDPSCLARSRNMFAKESSDCGLLCDECENSTMRPEISAAEHDLQLKFFRYLLDIHREQEDLKDVDKPSEELVAMYDICKREVEFVLKWSEYNTIDLSKLWQNLSVK